LPFSHQASTLHSGLKLGPDKIIPARDSRLSDRRRGQS
jgi:hypothetical protein